MEMFLPLILGLLLAVFIGRLAYKKEKTKPRKIMAALLGAVFGFFAPLIIAAFVMTPPEKEKTKEELVMAKLTRSLDGCPLDMKDRVKESMNDPDSFECIETNVIRRKDDYVMIMQFRGKNQLGGMVKNVAKAEYDSEGNFARFIN
ncbi:hypothetical protein V7O33_22825 [Escherichia coli]|uniref:hypothetical protein n=1 Tax=Escherichia coli TaxID=562 RepID=UPI00398CAE56